MKYATASRRYFVALAVLAFAQTVVIVAFAGLLTRAITGAIDGMPPAELAGTLAWLAGVVVLRAALVWGRDAVSARAAARVQMQLRSRLVAAVGELGPEWLAQRNSAQLAVIAGHGLDALEAYFGRYLPQLVLTVIATPVILAVMWSQDWISGLTVLLTLPLIPVFMVLIGLATRTVQKRQWSTLHRLAARFADTLNGLSTLIVYGRQHRAAASIERVTQQYRRETIRVLRVSFLSGFALEFLASISVAIVAVSIGFRLLDGSLTLGIGLLVLLLAPEAYLPLRQVGVQFHAAAEGVAATGDVFAVLDAVPPHPPSVQNTPSERVSARRVLDTRLELREARALRGGRMLAPVSLVAAPGTVTLVEGPSGAGKSSLLAVLRGACGYEGHVRVGDRDLGSLRTEDWLAWAGQDAGLLAGTVADNVALGDPEPDPGRIERSLALACADGIRPDTTVGVQGSGLSGGQGQRVAVARAIYRLLSGRAGVLALDEPSAALDSDTETRLWASLRDLADGGATVILVSHRPTARAVADQVVQLPAEVPA